jgi:hypothetical protein
MLPLQSFVKKNISPRDMGQVTKIVFPFGVSFLPVGGTDQQDVVRSVSRTRAFYFNSMMRCMSDDMPAYNETT